MYISKGEAIVLVKIWKFKAIILEKSPINLYQNVQLQFLQEVWKFKSSCKGIVLGQSFIYFYQNVRLL